MPSTRVRAIDWLRGLVMVLMTIDHAGSMFDAHHLHGDRAGVPMSPLPAGEFLTRWVTHLCAPAFVLLAGAALALSTEKRGDQRGQTAFIVKRGFLIAALDPLWMSLGFALYHAIIFQVLYAIGISLVCMAFLRRLSSGALVAAAIAIQLLGELSSRVQPETQPWHALWSFLFVGGPPFRPAMVAYPLVPWLSMMMIGWVLGRWIIATRAYSDARRARTLALVGVALLAVFAIVRGVDGYGNWGLYRDSLAPLQWLHVAKYPPSLAYTTLELGLAFLLLAFLSLLERHTSSRVLHFFSVLGSTAFFFYLIHVHLLGSVMLASGIDRDTHGLLKTYGATAAVLIVLYPLCVLYQRYKAAHPDGWTRYI
jgi:uncharacterized membrane protein